MHSSTADPHYGHSDVIRICDRLFASVAIMNSHLLAECRARVKADDDLRILEDFTADISTEAQRHQVRDIFSAFPMPCFQFWVVDLLRLRSGPLFEI